MKDENIVIAVLVIALAVFLIGNMGGFQGMFGIGQENIEKPANINQEEDIKDTGASLKLYDENGNIIPIPDWFSTAETTPGFAILGIQPEPTCTVTSDCPDYDINPYIDCVNHSEWTESKCALAGVSEFAIGMNVKNIAPPYVNYTDTVPISYSREKPEDGGTGYSYAYGCNEFNCTKVLLEPDESAYWQSDDFGNYNADNWNGTGYKFSVTVQGTNSYTGENITVSDSITLDILPSEGGLTGEAGVFVN